MRCSKGRTLPRGLTNYFSVRVTRRKMGPHGGRPSLQMNREWQTLCRWTILFGDVWSSHYSGAAGYCRFHVDLENCDRLSSEAYTHSQRSKTFHDARTPAPRSRCSQAALWSETKTTNQVTVRCGAVIRTSTLQQQAGWILDAFLHANKKCYRLFAVHNTMIVAQGQIHHRTSDDLLAD